MRHQAPLPGDDFALGHSRGVGRGGVRCGRSRHGADEVADFARPHVALGGVCGQFDAEHLAVRAGGGEGFVMGAHGG